MLLCAEKHLLSSVVAERKINCLDMGTEIKAPNGEGVSPQPSRGVGSIINTPSRVRGEPRPKTIYTAF